MENKLAQLIYNRLMGYEDRPIPELPVENLFAQGAPCDELYEEIYAANLRLCRRLGVEEDGDIQVILDRCDQINRLVAERMFFHASRLGAGR